MKHTPGPWMVEDCPCGHLGCSDKHIFPAGKFTQGSGFKEADARLIAAAPELLEALEDMVEVVDAEVPFPADTTARARAIIAKAKGDE